MPHLNILLIDDSPSDAKLLTRMLQTITDYTVEITIITRLDEAKICLEEADYQITLLDLSLPDSDSQNTIKQIERLVRKTPLIVLTGLADNDTGVMAVKSGAQDYLVKQNLNADSLIRSIRYALARQQAREVKQKASLLQAELERERYLNDLKTEFINIVSHEFRTPLSIILSSNEILEHHYAQLTDEKRRRRHENIRSAVQRMDTMVENILLLGQSENGEFQVNKQTVDLTELCQNTINDLSATRDSTRLHFVSEGAPTHAIMDQHLIRQVVSNLTINALKYSDESTTVNIHLRCTSDGFTLTVSDKGIGIPEEARRNLFVPFYRVDNGFKKQGTGLGLVIVKKIVEAHGGSIEIQSEVNIGTSVTVTIPARNT